MCWTWAQARACWPNACATLALRRRSTLPQLPETALPGARFALWINRRVRSSTDFDRAVIALFRAA